MVKMKVKALAPWFGSNRMGAANVARMIGRRSWVGIAFAGGMAEVPAIDARTITVNDLHRHIINLARVVADHWLGPMLYRRLRHKLFHVDELRDAQAYCDFVERGLIPPRGDPSVEWAERYFVSAWMSRASTAGARDEFSSSASLRWEASGGDSPVRFRGAIRELVTWRRHVFPRCQFTAIDAIEFMGKCKDVPENAVYCDPPFPGPGDRYKFAVDDAFQKTLSVMAASFQKCRVVMRFYDHPLIRALYPGPLWEWHRFAGRTQANKESAEVLLVNRYSLGDGALIAA